MKQENEWTFITLRDLIRRAATFKGLNLLDGSRDACSESIKEYVLGRKLLEVLEKNNIKRQNRPDCGNEVFTLVDHGRQESIPGFLPSNGWNFPKRGDSFDLRMTLSFGFGINLKRRGVVFFPRAHGSGVSAGDWLPNFRMFKALVENDGGDIIAVAKELAKSKGSIVVTWTELGLGGLRRLSDLFLEFADRKESILRLDKDDQIFDPVPNPYYRQPGDELFVPEPVQPSIFEKWEDQLKRYQNSLTV